MSISLLLFRVQSERVCFSHAVTAVGAEFGAAHASGHPHLAEVRIPLQKVRPPQVRNLLHPFQTSSINVCTQRLHAFGMHHTVDVIGMCSFGVHAGHVVKSMSKQTLQCEVTFNDKHVRELCAGRPTGRCARCSATTPQQYQQDSRATAPAAALPTSCLAS